MIKPSSPSLLIAEGNAEEAKRMNHAARDALSASVGQ